MLQSLRKDKVENSGSDCDRLCSNTSANDPSAENQPICNRADKSQDPNLQSKEEDLDFLLSLKEPVRSHHFSVLPPIRSGLEGT